MTTMLKNPPKTPGDKTFSEVDLFDAIDQIDKGFLENALDVLHLDDHKRYRFFAEIADCKINRAISSARVQIETGINDRQRFVFSVDGRSISAPPSCFTALQIKELTTARDNMLKVDVVIYEKTGGKPKASIRV